jgi:hypothetical protein
MNHQDGLAHGLATKQELPGLAERKISGDPSAAALVAE